MSIELIRVIGMYRSKNLWSGTIESRELDGCSASVTDGRKYLDISDGYIPLRDFNCLQATQNFPAQSEEWLWKEVNHEYDTEALRVTETGSEQWLREFCDILDRISEQLSVDIVKSVDARLRVWRTILDENSGIEGMYVEYAPETDDEASGSVKASEVDW